MQTKRKLTHLTEIVDQSSVSGMACNTYSWEKPLGWQSEIPGPTTSSWAMIKMQAVQFQRNNPLHRSAAITTITEYHMAMVMVK